MPSYLNENPVIAPRLGVRYVLRISRRLAAACMLDSVLPMATLSSRSVVVAIVAGTLGFPRLAWSAPPPPSTAFLSIPLSQKTTRGCHKRALPTTPPSSCSVSEATDRQTRTCMVTGPSGRRARGALAASNDRGAMGTDEHATWDDQTVTSADALVWPESDSPAHSQELPVPFQTQLVDADATAAAAAAAVAAVAVAIFLAPHDAAAVSTTTTNIQLAAQASAAPVDIGAILTKAGKASFGGGASGAAAAVVQVLSLMWLRTTMNFQYKNGGSTEDALRTLWEEGGVPRLYKGISFALVQGPLSRFGDTAANVGVLTLLEAFESTRSLPLPVKSAAGSVAAGLWRIGLTPIDAYKTTLQVSGAEGTKLLTEKVAANGPSVLFEGALATATATFVGHYPWYFTYNSLGAWLPPAPANDQLLKLGRQAFLGLCSSCVSDCCSNSIRVIKTTKQTAPVPISYPEAFKQVVDDDGVAGLFLRGLQTRILVNALQGALFAVAWKYFQEIFRTGGGF